MRKLNLLTTGAGLATAAFWFTMLTNPPRTQAALASRAPCAQAGQSLAPWFDRENARRAFVKVGRHDDYNLLLTWFGSARRQCASGSADAALADLRALEGMVMALEERRRQPDDL